MRTISGWALMTVVMIAGCDEKKTSTSPSAAPVPAPAPAPAGSGAAAPTSTASAGSRLPKFDPQQTLLFAPIPAGVETPVLDDATKLGMAMFTDARISGDGKTSCVSCHSFTKAGQDGAATAGASGADGGTDGGAAARNTPTVWNAGGSFAQGWDARWSTIEELVVPHVVEMTGGDEKKIVAAAGAAYGAAFAKSFPDEKPAVTADTVGRALGGYTKKLFARARWDRYLGGDKSALSEAELTGFAMFVEAGCTSCHQGKYVGATQTQKLGIAKPWPGPIGSEPGRFAVTKQESDRGMFKVPSLRNVTRTGPWLHDGSATSLEELTKLMARHQVGRELDDAQAAAIVTFLATLEGNPPKELLPKGVTLPTPSSSASNAPAPSASAAPPP
ncbi:MAG: c-type cytochrome [Labilithrix sp.]|nr:c-type cytochrome [Labilithrix sp.]MCW5809865.1 c-type cytochrome [Labilithrix sp.]